MDECPCGGDKSTKWHDRRNLVRCQSSKDLRSLRARGLRAGVEAWIPGTPILVPEIDPL